jgi:predicted nucleic acid-binding Zn ribbon protein
MAVRPKPYDFTLNHLNMETFMRMLESIGHAAWTTCEECGNDFPAGTYRCGRCGHVPNLLHRMASFAATAFQKRSIKRPKRSQGAYPGLAEGALKFYQARGKRVERMIWIGLLAGGAIIVWAFSGPRFSDMDLKPQPVSSHALAVGAVVPMQPASANAAGAGAAARANVSRVPPPVVATATPGDAEFYRAIDSRNLFVAHRRLAAMVDKGDASPQLQQMRADLSSRERLRDDLLHHAWRCRASGDWPCVSDNAAQASAIDTSSVSARRLVAQAAQARNK